MIDNDKGGNGVGVVEKNTNAILATLLVACAKSRARSGQCPPVLEVEGSTPALALATRARATRAFTRV